MPAYDSPFHLDRICVYPVKSLPGFQPRAWPVNALGQLQGDRGWRLVDAEGRTLHAKGNAALQQISVQWQPRDEGFDFRLEASGHLPGAGHLPGDEPAFSSWCGRFLKVSCRLEPCGPGLAFTDDTASPGPTVIGSATLEELSHFLPHIDPEEWSQRLRGNLEIGGLPAFGEDLWLAPYGTPADQCRRVRIGTAEWHITQPCQRCVVPSREPGSGVREPGFAEKVAAFRLDHRPVGVDPAWFPHGYKLALNTAPAIIPAGTVLRIGDPVQILD